MEVKAISFTCKTFEIKGGKKAYDYMLAKLLGQSDKDYFALTRKHVEQPQINSEKFLLASRNFFLRVFGQ